MPVITSVEIATSQGAVRLLDQLVSTLTMTHQDAGFFVLSDKTPYDVE